MIFEIEISEQADADLRGIFEYIAIELPLRLHHFRFDLIEQSKRPDSQCLWTFNLLLLPMIVQNIQSNRTIKRRLPTKNVKKKWTQRYRNWDLVLNQLTILYGERINQYL